MTNKSIPADQVRFFSGSSNPALAAAQLKVIYTIGSLVGGDDHDDNDDDDNDDHR